MQIKTVKPQRLYMQVADQIRRSIRTGTPAPGERLPSERDLAERFGVSRPTIREAMIALEIAALVEIRSGSGVYVAATDSAAGQPVLDQGAGPFEILEARRVVEAECAALAAQRASSAQLARLAELLEEMAAENLQENMTEAADQRFHCLIAEAAGNSVLASTVDWLWQLRNDSVISTHFHQRVRLEGSRPIIEDHQRILGALQSRDAAAARDAMTVHLQRVVDTLMAAE
ncbi:FadR/GntR family transcriptional regulator [Haliea sp. E17]|uniref:FadR/GntR family transcriptional regulator n=1 Tax=Haliea sp. E17 TaxID=3401576 RepID=UPI003AAF874C